MTLRDCQTSFETEASVKFLGVTLDQTLRWGHHIVTLSEKAFCEIYQAQFRVTFWEPLIMLNVTYWGHMVLLFRADAERIFALQSRTARIVSGVPNRSNCKAAFITIKNHEVPKKFYFWKSSHTCNTRNMELIKKCQIGPKYLASKFFNNCQNSKT